MVQKRNRTPSQTRLGIPGKGQLNAGSQAMDSVFHQMEALFGLQPSGLIPFMSRFKGCLSGREALLAGLGMLSAPSFWLRIPFQPEGVRAVRSTLRFKFPVLFPDCSHSAGMAIQPSWSR